MAGVRNFKVLTAVLAALALPGLAACAGFTPMYAQPGVVAGVSRIDVRTPSTRTGFLLRESLEDALAWDRSAPAAYRLQIRLDERRTPRGLDENRVATRYEVRLEASYVLTELGTGRTLLRGSRPVNITYDTTDQPYAGIVAQQDSQVRAADQVAQLIKTDIVTYFASR